jgi:replicative superfamily II helicase
MSKADVLVCTPEKWDLISRGWRDSGREFVKQCKLLIIDEIHLLGEERGAVLEAIGENPNEVKEIFYSIILTNQYADNPLRDSLSLRSL